MFGASAKQKCFIGLVALQLLLLVFWGNMKKGWHVDELYTFDLSNSYFAGFLNFSDTFINNWHDNSYWNECVSIQEGERFSFDSVFYNQSTDVHPPVYYIVINSICSVFLNDFSKWYGLIPNIIFFLGVQVLLYKISKILWDDTWTALIPCTLYGFSIGAITTTIFIRMYMLFAFWVLLSLYFHLKLYEQMRETSGIFPAMSVIELLAVSCCGFLTQYYFIIWEFYIAAIFSLMQIVQKRWKCFLSYALIMFLSLIISYIIFPACYIHILGGGYRGNEAFANLATSNLQMNIKKYFDIINAQMFGGFFIIFMSISICTFAVLFALKSRNQQIGQRYFRFTSLNFAKGIMIVLPCIFYIITIAKISPDPTDRYVFPIYPLLALGTGFLFSQSYVKHFAVMLLNTLFLICILFASFWRQRNHDINYLYEDFESIAHVVSYEYPNSYAIYVNPNDWQYVYNLALFRQHKSVYVVSLEKLDGIKDALDERNVSDDHIFVYVAASYSEEQDNIINSIKVQGNFSSVRYLYENGGSIFLLYN